MYEKQDEIDGLVGHRRDASSEGGVSRVLSQMLTEMDGVQPLRNVVVLAATNRPDLLVCFFLPPLFHFSSSLHPHTYNTHPSPSIHPIQDEALLRPGRVDRALYCRAPDREERLEILRVHCRNVPHCEADLEEVAEETVMYSGAELAALCNTAALTALREDIDAAGVTRAHWRAALERCPPTTITAEVLEHYAAFRMHYAQQR